MSYLSDVSQKKEQHSARKSKSDYLACELDKIYTSNEYTATAAEGDSLNLAMAVSYLLLFYKGLNVKILDMKGISPLADYFVIADVQNSVQASAIASEIAYQVKRLQRQIRGVEGGSESNWTLIDLNSVIVHLFIEKSREIYNLESLWPHAIRITVPDAFYYNSQNSASKYLEHNSADSEKDYY
ncbi:MAG: ribosome silencing factor [Oligoflexia bacterium]|nr:ribosome silencing factor [Oligoflexia bacterium]MBF0366080.1 ribosome silencing factor [Oligoflexia bacterium]